MMSAKMVTPGFLKIGIFWTKDYNVIIFVHDVTNKYCSCDSNYIIVVVMRPKFGNCSISMRKVIWLQFYKGWSWFKFNKLGLALGTNFKFYTSVAKVLKLKVRMVLRLNSTFVEVTGEKLVGGPSLLPILNRVNEL